jgi:hypothetical protein
MTASQTETPLLVATNGIRVHAAEIKSSPSGTAVCRHRPALARHRLGQLIPFLKGLGLVFARRRSRRSNPDSTARALDCFAALAMTVGDFAGWYKQRAQRNTILGVTAAKLLKL